MDASFSRWLPVVQRYSQELALEASRLRLKPDDREIMAVGWLYVSVPTVLPTEYHDSSMYHAALGIGPGGRVQQRGGGFGTPTYSRVTVQNAFVGYQRPFPYRDATPEEIREAFVDRLSRGIRDRA